MKGRWLALDLIALVFLIASPTSARADSYDYVMTPYFDPGRVSLRASWGVADKRSISSSGQALSVGYGVNDYWYTELWISNERDRGEPLSSHGWYWSNQIKLASSEHSDWALYASYWKPPTGAGGWEWTIGPMLQVAGQGFDLNLNVLVRRWLHPRGFTQGTELSYQGQIKTLWRPGWELGAQAYGELGNPTDWEPFRKQEHMWGPAIFGHHGGWHYDAALLAGLTKASARAQIRAQVAYSF